MKRLVLLLVIATAVWALWLCQSATPWAGQAPSLLRWSTSKDALLVAGPKGEILYKKNETHQYPPASTLKILTSLAALHYLGTSYRFRTEFYLDGLQNLKMKGYGDPLLISEVLQEVAQSLGFRLKGYKNLVLDNSYFARDIQVPGVRNSTNPYDAPVGALAANFNTVFLEWNEAGKIISAEPQTPMTPLALKSIQRLRLRNGRYTFSHNSREAALYAGELLVHFLKKAGRASRGGICLGLVKPEDKLLFTYQSVFTMGEVLDKMLEFSSNFMANQIFLALGAHVYGPPGTLEKGVRAVSRYAKDVLQLSDIKVVEGSGICQKNRLSALDMLSILKAFEPHRDLLVREGRVLYKSGSLKGLSTRAGYVECRYGGPYYFVMFIKGPDRNVDTLMDNIAEELSCLNE